MRTGRLPSDPDVGSEIIRAPDRETTGRISGFLNFLDRINGASEEIQVAAGFRPSP